MTKPVEMFFALLRRSLDESAPDDRRAFARAGEREWEDVFALSVRQGAVLLTYGGLQHLPADTQPPRKLKLRWCANVIKGSERYDRYRLVIRNLSQMLAQNGIDLLILKGVSMSKLYPVPYYREGGDIDAYLFDKSAEADELVSSHGIRVAYPIPKHSAFAFEGQVIENHRTLFDTEIRFAREAAFYGRMEDMLKGMFTHETCPELGIGSARELPPQAAAIYLIGHIFRHFCCMDANVRQLCDWTVFFSRNRELIDRELLERQIDELGLGRFVTAVNGFCAARLGFEPWFMVPDRNGKTAAKETRFILDRVMKYRIIPKVRIPAVGPLRHIIARNTIYKRYLGKISPSEFLIPEIRSYFSYKLKRKASGGRPADS